MLNCRTSVRGLLSIVAATLLGVTSSPATADTTPSLSSDGPHANLEATTSSVSFGFAPNWIPGVSGWPHYWATTSAEAAGWLGWDVTGWLFPATNYFYCKALGGLVFDTNDAFNHWWMWTDLDSPRGARGWVPAYFLAFWGNNEARDDWGNEIPDCP